MCEILAEQNWGALFIFTTRFLPVVSDLMNYGKLNVISSSQNQLQFVELVSRCPSSGRPLGTHPFLLCPVWEYQDLSSNLHDRYNPLAFDCALHPQLSFWCYFQLIRDWSRIRSHMSPSRFLHWLIVLGWWGHSPWFVCVWVGDAAQRWVLKSLTSLSAFSDSETSLCWHVPSRLKMFSFES